MHLKALRKSLKSSGRPELLQKMAWMGAGNEHAQREGRVSEGIHGNVSFPVICLKFFM